MGVSEKTPSEITVSLPILAKMIDHSLLHPTMTDSIIRDGATFVEKI
jgi:deoxyribose-phosphate aldolase